MITQLQNIRNYIAKNAPRTSQGDVQEKWVLETLQQLDALLSNLVTSQDLPGKLVPKSAKTKERKEKAKNNRLKKIVGPPDWPLRPAGSKNPLF